MSLTPVIHRGLLTTQVNDVVSREIAREALGVFRAYEVPREHCNVEAMQHALIRGLALLERIEAERQKVREIRAGVAVTLEARRIVREAGR